MVKTQYENIARDTTEKIEVSKTDRLEYVRNPVIAEFLGLDTHTDINELETGYAFVARRQHIKTEHRDYHIDLVFYNYHLKCFILIDLKTQKITHQDVGQMDMYVRMYDDLKKVEGDIPVIPGRRMPAYYCDSYNRDGERITVAGSGAGAGYVQYWNQPIFVCEEGFMFLLTDQKVKELSRSKILTLNGLRFDGIMILLTQNSSQLRCLAITS